MDDPDIALYTPDTPGSFFIFCLLGSLFVLPIGYILLCVWMHSAKVSHPPYFPFFCLFGAVGGWMLTVVIMPGIGTFMGSLFLLFVAPMFMLISVIWMATLSERNAFHYTALCGSLAYISFALITFWFAHTTSLA